MALLDLPTEILSQIFVSLNYRDFTSLVSTCHATRPFSRDQLLWRAVFIHDFDDPRRRLVNLSKTPRLAYELNYTITDWQVELKKRIVALGAIKHNTVLDAMTYPEAYKEWCETMLAIIDTADLLPGDKSNIDWFKDIGPTANEYIRGVILLQTAPALESDPTKTSQRESSTLANNDRDMWGPSPGRPMTRSRAAIQADNAIRPEGASRLHVLCGWSICEHQDEKSAGRARRICYDLSLTNAQNEYGPWKADGSGETDWRRTEAIMSVVTQRFFRAARRRLELPQGVRYSVPWCTPKVANPPEDWAGVSRKWIGTYVFMHWEDLVEYNDFRNTASRPTLETIQEACGGIMKLELSLDMGLDKDEKLKTNLPWCDDLPPLYFSGLSRSDDWQMATGIRGMVCLAPGGREVRWRYIVSYGGADQWQLEGVQPGGVRSGCVYGTWTSVGHDDDGPVGPFLYVAEELCRML